MREAADVEGRSAASATLRKRPKDRSERILAAAAQLFRERGFHSVGIDEIGEAVGITGPAVYRHFENKEALLVAAAQRAAARVLVATRDAVESGRSPEDTLKELARAGVSATFEDSDMAAVYLRETRHVPVLPHAIQADQRESARMFLDALLALRPDLSRQEAGFRLQALVGLFASVISNPSTLGRERVEELLARMCVVALLAEVPANARSPEDGGHDASSASALRRRTSRRESILAVAIELFQQHGYNGVGIDDIGAAAGITGPGVYRHFQNKEDVLASALNRANEQLAASVTNALAASRTSEEALVHLAASYADLAVHNRDLIAVYLTEGHALSPERQAGIRRAQKAYVEDWLRLLLDTRPQLREAEGRTMVAGATGLITGYGWGVVRLPAEQGKAVLTAMTTAALLRVDVDDLPEGRPARVRRG